MKLLQIKTAMEYQFISKKFDLTQLADGCVIFASRWMSAYPSEADIQPPFSRVRFVPKTDTTESRPLDHVVG